MKGFRYAGLLAVVAALPGFVGTAWAGASVTVTISTNIVPACTIAATNPSLGNYSSALLTGNGSVTVNCTEAYTVTASGANASGVRQMERTGTGGGTLNYTLHRDAGDISTIWTTAADERITGTGSSTARTHDYYVTVPAGQTGGAGAYTDEVTLTLDP